ncbi:hypothetical protein BC332_16924 [Capsicum chinense]|nr:hypothetical protein BC332_16924 [Capsicum chinense]
MFPVLHSKVKHAAVDFHFVRHHVDIKKNLRNLSILSLNNNHLTTGYIPKEIGYLRDLTYLHLNDNSLNGSIPTSFGNLNSLTIPYLHDNHLYGPIPEEIGYLWSLVGLSLKQQRLLAIQASKHSSSML